MNTAHRPAEPVVGLNVPARVGMSLGEVCTPALIVDLDAFEHNVRTMGEFVKSHGIRLRAHAKTHKSADIAHYQINHGGACGICCQKLAEAEALVAAGIDDVLISNQVVDPAKIQRLVALASRARVRVCVDNASNVGQLSTAAGQQGVLLECLVEVDVGAGRCGVAPGEAVVNLARRITAAGHLRFAGLQAYQGSAQHIRDYAQRQESVQAAVALVEDTLARLNKAGLDCEIVSGAGTGSYYFEAASGVYNELQCGSYIFMDADYQRILDVNGEPISAFRNSLFILSSVMSHVKPDRAVCDAGLKVQSVDSGLPVIHGQEDLEYLHCSDEHGLIADPNGRLKLNDRVLLIPGHCDPTCNLHDWYVAVRDGQVEALWPVTARGMAF